MLCCFRTHVFLCRVSVALLKCFPVGCKATANSAVIILFLLFVFQVYDLFTVSYSQGYHRPRDRNKDDWGKFNFPSRNETTFGGIVSVCTTNVGSYLYVFIFRHNLLQQCLILRKKTRASRIPSSRKTFIWLAYYFVDSIKC